MGQSYISWEEVTALKGNIFTHAWLLFVFVTGFAKSQAELIVSALVTLTTANMDIVYKDMVTKAHQV